VVPTITIKTRGMKETAATIANYEKRAKNLSWLLKLFRKYILDNRIPSMFRNGGRVPGRYGKGFKLWAKNSPLVRLVKSDSRVFYKHNRSKSSIEEAYKFNGTVGASNGSMKCSLRNTHKAVKYLQTEEPGGRIITHPTGGFFAIPIGMGRTIVRRSYKLGKRPARQIEGFQRGDEKWIEATAQKRMFEVAR